MLIERKEKKRKEKKSKGLFYLIFTLTIIAALTISCKNKPTGSNDFSGFNEYTDIDFDDARGFAQFVGKTIRSRDALLGSTFYFWATFDDNGIKYGSGSEGSKPITGNLDGYVLHTSLNKSALSSANNKANFSDNKGSIFFEAKAGDKVSKITVTFDKDSGYAKEYIDASPFECQFVNE